MSTKAEPSPEGSPRGLVGPQGAPGGRAPGYRGHFGRGSSRGSTNSAEGLSDRGQPSLAEWP